MSRPVVRSSTRFVVVLVVVFQKVNCVSTFNNFSPFPFAGRVPPLHRGAPAAREGLRLHLVQPAGGQEEVLQEAREEDVTRRGEEVQGGAHGEVVLIENSTYYVVRMYVG